MPSVLAFRNRQRARPLNLPLLRRLTLQVLQTELGIHDYQLGIHFVEAKEMASLNQRFLQHEGSTDVITFDHAGLGAPVSSPACSNKLRQHAGLETGAPNLHGEIFISVPDAVKQARAFGTTWQSEIVRYIIHGLLHLRGFDDLQPRKRREMKREENRLLLKLARQFSLKQIAPKRRPQPSTLNPHLP
jgi:probable rRNA maturation factor